MPPPSSSGSDDAAVDISVRDDQLSDIASTDSPDSSNVVKSGPDVEVEPDYDDDDSGFPTPPVFVVNGDATTVQHSNADADDGDRGSKVFAAEASDSVDRPSSTASFNVVVPDISELPPPLPPPPPPPPAPPLPTSFNTPAASTPHWSSPAAESSSGPRSATSAALTQRQQLEESRRRDESHAALMAAIARRRSLLDSTDAEHVARAIENQIQRSSKLQVVYRAGAQSSEQRLSGDYSDVPPTGLLAPAGRHDAPKAAENGQW